MTLELSNSPGKPEVKTWFESPPAMHLHCEGSHIEISPSDFCHAMYYFLVNTPLSGDSDPRLVFIKVVSRLTREGNAVLYKGRTTFSLAYPGNYPEEQ